MNGIDIKRLLEYNGPVEIMNLDAELEEHLNERGTYEKHRVGLAEILEVHEGEPRYFLNRLGRRAPVIMVGPTMQGRLLCIPIEPTGRWGVWRPVTAFEANQSDKERYYDAG